MCSDIGPNLTCLPTLKNPGEGHIYSYDNFGNGLLVTIISSTMEYWTIFVYWYIDADYQWSAAFFILLVLITNWLILSLFTSVMMTEFSAAWGDYMIKTEEMQEAKRLLEGGPSAEEEPSGGGAATLGENGSDEEDEEDKARDKRLARRAKRR